jgi:hypothetical protein
MIVVQIDYDNIDRIWPFIEGFMDATAAETNGRFTTASLKANIPFRGQQLWVAVDEVTDKPYGAVITEVFRYPATTALNIAFAGGVDFKLWVGPLLEECQKFGKLHGCSKFEICGRPAWGKILKFMGCKPEYTLFTWDIGSGPLNITDEVTND